MAGTNGKTRIDPRVRRTRRLLQEAVLELASAHDFSEITVRDITEKAEINRATFYQHYSDKEELIGKALDALFDELTEEAIRFSANHDPLKPESIPPPLVALFQHVGDRPELYRRLLAESGSTTFARRLREFHVKQFLSHWKDMALTALPGTPPPEVRAQYAAAAVQGLISWWLETGHRETAQTMATWSWELLSPLWFGMEDDPPLPA